MPLAFIDDPGDGSRITGLDCPVHLFNIQSVLCQNIPVIPDHDLGQTDDFLNIQIACAGDPPDDLTGLIPFPEQRIQVIPVNIDQDIRGGPCQQMIEQHFHRLGKEETDPGNRGRHFFFHQGFQLILGPCLCPFFTGSQIYDHFGHFQRHGIGGDLSCADLGGHLLHLIRKFLQQHLLKLGIDTDRLLQGSPRLQDRVYGKIPFIQFRDKNSPHPEKNKYRSNKKHDDPRGHRIAVTQCRTQQFLISPADPGDDPVGQSRSIRSCRPHDPGGHHRHIGQAQDHRTDQCRAECDGHGPEHFTLLAGEGKDRDEDDQDDELTENGGTHHAAG